MSHDRMNQLLQLWRKAGLLPAPEQFGGETALFDDAAYWKWADQRILLCALCEKIATYGTESGHLDLILTSERFQVVPGINRLREALENEQAWFDGQFNDYLAAARKARQPPRMLRLADRLELSAAELDILNLVIGAVCNTSFSRFRNRIGSLDVGEVGNLLNLDANDLFGHLSSAAAMIKAELIRLEKEILGGLRNSDVLIDFPIVKALRGLTLTDEDLHIINGTIVGQLLHEEGIEVDRSGDGTSPFGTDIDRDGDEPEDFTADGDGFDFELDDADEFDPDYGSDPTYEDASSDDQSAGASPTTGFLTENRSDREAYTTNAEYLDEHMEWCAARRTWKTLLMEGPDGISSFGEKRSYSAALRELESRARIIRARIDRRLEATREDRAFTPRGEELKAKWKLDDFEKHVLLIAAGLAASIQFREKMESRRGLEIGDILTLLCDSLEDQVAARRYFYKHAALVENGLINLRGADFGTDLLDVDVTIDQRLTDYLLGVDAESTSLVEGSHLYTPKVSVDRAVLPERVKSMIMSAVEGFPAFQRERERCGLDQLLDYGRGIVMLFYGASGTGKTMMANALATMLGKKVLLINFPTIGFSAADEVMKLLFREAELNDAVLFFDECDGIFQDRGTNSGISLLLSELERYPGLVIMATNRPFELDEAMRRRITLPVEFPPPDAAQRARIWNNHIPDKLRLSAAPDFETLGYRYELTGGLIKNAILAALSAAAARNPEVPEVSPADLDAAARNQVTAKLQMTDARDRIIPRQGLNRVVLPEALRASLLDLIAAQKARRTLISEWGFPEDSTGFGATALFHGPSGTGKTLAALAVAYELGRVVKRVNLARVVSKWVGEGAKNIEAVFDEAEHSGAVLLFDEADALFAGRSAVAAATDRYANLEVAVLLQRLEEFTGVAILTTNLFENIDQAFLRRIHFVQAFERPGKTERERLWQLHIPERMPLAEDVDFQSLAAAHRVTGGQIRNAILKAASRSAAAAGTRAVSQQDLVTAAKDEEKSSPAGRGIGFVPA